MSSILCLYDCSNGDLFALICASVLLSSSVLSMSGVCLFSSGCGGRDLMYSPVICVCIIELLCLEIVVDGCSGWHVGSGIIVASVLKIVFFISLGGFCCRVRE